MKFEEELQSKTAYCNEVLDRFLPAEEGPSRRVREAMNYSVRAGGKRLRPMLLWETCSMYGGRRELAEPFMAAIEMIHSYSLVHDDLPEMDNDEYRRGRKTTHAVYGQGMAVLAGDGLLNLAYETALGSFAEGQNVEETARIARALCVLAAGAGIDGMVGGQCCDLVSEGRQIDAQTLLYIHRKKTACMIASGFQIGAILAGAPETDIRSLGEIAEMVGIAFQIRDDILDVEGSAEALGKSIGKDAAGQKATYVSIHGLGKAREDAALMTEEALRRLDALSVPNPFLRELVLSLAGRTH